MASQSYLQIDGIKGESTDSAHKDWIEILSYSQGIGQSASATPSPAGGGTAATRHEPFVITKYVDLSSPKLYEMCSSGKHIKKVTVELMRASGSPPVKYMAIEMEEVVISAVSASATEVSGPPTDKVSFDYGSIKWTYTQQKVSGSGEDVNVTGGWNLTQNQVAS